jgi:nucleotide-binding universal stress UspA family protein
MAHKSILLGLDGSAQSRYAAELCWAMSKMSGYKVDAQHVVDSLAAWDFLAFDIAGFIGSGPYFAAHETMRNSLFTIGQTLVEVYKGLAEAQSIQGETYLDEGTTIREICWRAKEHDLVVLGHRSTGMQSPDEDKRKFPRRSIAELVTHYSPRPLLLVGDRVKLWTKVRFMLGSGQVPSDLITSCVEFTSKFSMEPSVRYVFTNDKSEAPIEMEKTNPDGMRVVTDLRKLVPQLANARFDVKTTDDVNQFLKNDAEHAEDDTLLIVPVTNVSGRRRTSLGPSPDVLVRYLNHSAILFWMEEEDSSDDKVGEGAAASSAKK